MSNFINPYVPGFLSINLCERKRVGYIILYYIIVCKSEARMYSFSSSHKITKYFDRFE